MAIMTSILNVQIPLKISSREEVSFDTFVTAEPATAILLNQFQASLRQKHAAGFYLQGASGAGKTHLLQAACRYKSSLNESSVYLPLKDTSLPLIADSLKGLEDVSLICIDDIDTKIHQVEWQKSLENLLIKAQAAGNIVVCTGETSYLEWDVVYSNLNSALVNVLTIPIPALSKNKDLVDALQRHAQKRGFELSTTVGNYLVKQFSSHLPELMAVLSLLEQESLAEKRHLKLPLVKKILGLPSERYS